MEPALRALLVQTLLIAPHTGRNAYGQPTYGADVPTPSRIERSFQTLATTTGAQVVSVTTAYVDGNAVVDESSRVTFPDGQITPLQGVKSVLDVAGDVHHYELKF
jgi:hypothetical protein